MIHLMNVFGMIVPDWMLTVSNRQAVLFLGCPAGLFLFIVRMRQKDLFKCIVKSIFSPHKINVSLI